MKDKNIRVGGGMLIGTDYGRRGDTTAFAMIDARTDELIVAPRINCVKSNYPIIDMDGTNSVIKSMVDSIVEFRESQPNYDPRLQGLIECDPNSDNKIIYKMSDGVYDFSSLYKSFDNEDFQKAIENIRKGLINNVIVLDTFNSHIGQTCTQFAEASLKNASQQSQIIMEATKNLIERYRTNANEISFDKLNYSIIGNRRYSRIRKYVSYLGFNTGMTLIPLIFEAKPGKVKYLKRMYNSKILLEKRKRSRR